MAKLVSIPLLSCLVLTIPPVSSLLDDVSTWRGELKKIAVSIACSFYKLQCYSSSEDDPTAYVERTAATLLKKLMFLRDGFDENVSQPATVNDADFFFRVKQETLPIPLSNSSSLISSTQAPMVPHNNALMFSATAFLFSVLP